MNCIDLKNDQKQLNQKPQLIRNTFNLFHHYFPMNFPINFPFPSRIGGKQNQRKATSKPNQPWCSGVCEENHRTARKFKYKQLIANPCGLRHKVGQIWDRSQIGSNQPTLNVSSKLNLSFPFGELILVDEFFFSGTDTVSIALVIRGSLRSQMREFRPPTLAARGQVLKD